LTVAVNLSGVWWGVSGNLVRLKRRSESSLKSYQVCGGW